MNFLTYFVSSGKTYLSTMSPNQKVAIEPRAEVNQAKICPKTAKNCKYSYLQCNIIKILLNFSTYFCLFKPKSGQRANSWNEQGKNLPKTCRKMCKMK